MASFAAVNQGMVASAFDTVTPLRVTGTEKGRVGVSFFVPAPGLYQFNLFLDATDFDWESLYQTLNAYNNVNQRTGPWDFDLQTAGPLVPSYWIQLDGLKLGLWYVQRVMIEDLRAKRFRGRFAFHVAAAGPHELSFEPYKPAKVTWVSALIEPDPEDTLEPLPIAARDSTALPVARWAEPSFWEEQRRRLATSHAVYRKPMERVCDWAVKQGGGNHAWLIAPLVAAHHLAGAAGALDHARRIAKHWTDLPAWGRPREDVYGHNGDIGGADTFRCMAWAVHLLQPFLSDDERRRMLDKLAYQGDQLLTQTLLMRDYWGGSVLQDHGRQAVLDLATGALHLWGIIPQAERWLSYALPRSRRSLDAAPPDGVIPGSSYHAIYMYVHNAMWLRDALRGRTGEDLIDHPSLRNVPAFVADVLHDPTHSMLIPEGRVPLVGGLSLMAAIASKHHDRVAQRVHHALLDSPEFGFFHGGQMVGFYCGILWGLFAYDPTILPEPAAAHTGQGGAPPKMRAMRWHEDAGFAQFRDDDATMVLAVRCGPWLGYHAHRKANGPCDRMDMSVGAGHFVLYLDGKPILCSPDSGYKLSTALRSCMLVDDRGQIGDVGYPMSIPSMPHRGEEIEAARFDGRRGFIRLNLARAYPAQAGVLHYTRTFLVGDGRRLVCRDHVVLDAPRQLAWLFQHKLDDGATLNGVIAKVGHEPALTIQPVSPGVALGASLARTPVVFSYASASGFKPFQHVRYDTADPVGAACVDFVMGW